jgi:mannose-6-phosphate isomerase-like protein (cupin superfamily)
MPTLKNTSGGILEIEIDGKKVKIKPGESIKIPDNCNFKAEGDFILS